jgi:hypothetical protein
VCFFGFEWSLAVCSTIFIYRLADGVLVSSAIPLTAWLLTKATLSSRIIRRRTVVRVLPELILDVSLNT